MLLYHVLAGEVPSSQAVKLSSAKTLQVGSLVVSRVGRFGRKLVGASGATVPAGAFDARFVEVRVDSELGLLRITRILSAIADGRVVNEKLARSQIIGGTVGGIGMAMFEDTISDAVSGRIANPTFGDYLLAVTDVPDMDVVFVGERDPDNPVGDRASDWSALLPLEREALAGFAAIRK
jgi:CO/xanthine dehydrogenase Mo-binding subunit